MNGVTSFLQNKLNGKVLQPFLHSTTRTTSNYYHFTGSRISIPAIGQLQLGKHHHYNQGYFGNKILSKHDRISKFRLYSKDRSNNDLLNTILSPFDYLWKFLSYPIGGDRGSSTSTSIPLIYPLTILLFNIFFNNTTSIILDTLVGAFYLFIQQIHLSNIDDDDVLDDEVDAEILLQQPQIVNALVLFASITTALLISPNGFQTREIGAAPVGYVLIAGLVLWVSWLSFILSSNNNIVGSKSKQLDEVDPSQRLLDLWDEKFEKKSK